MKIKRIVSGFVLVLLLVALAVIVEFRIRDSVLEKESLPDGEIPVQESFALDEE